jgi:hypothetical protein
MKFPGLIKFIEKTHYKNCFADENEIYLVVCITYEQFYQFLDKTGEISTGMISRFEEVS